MLQETTGKHRKKLWELLWRSHASLIAGHPTLCSSLTCFLLPVSSWPFKKRNKKYTAIQTRLSKGRWWECFSAALTRMLHRYPELLAYLPIAVAKLFIECLEWWQQGNSGLQYVIDGWHDRTCTVHWYVGKGGRLLRGLSGQIANANCVKVCLQFTWFASVLWFLRLFSYEATEVWSQAVCGE